MFEKIRDIYYNLDDVLPAILAIVVTILIIALIFGFVFGIYCFLGWILMFVWGAIAAAFGLPVFSFWVYVGIAVLLSSFTRTVTVKANKD